MSPIADGATGLDLMRALGLPAILVGGSYLGAISHTLTAIEVLRADLPIAAVVVSQAADPEAPDFAQTVDMIREFAVGLRVIPAPRTAPEPWANALLDAVLTSGA